MPWITDRAVQTIPGWTSERHDRIGRLRRAGEAEHCGEGQDGAPVQGR